MTHASLVIQPDLSPENFVENLDRLCREVEKLRYQLTLETDNPNPGTIQVLHQADSLLSLGMKNLQILTDRVDDELERVREIQNNLLPNGVPESEGIDFACQYIPCGQASGDYYDFLQPSVNHQGVIVADVAGHGADAAVVMAITRVLVHVHLDQLLLPGGALGVLNRLMGRFVPSQQFVTAVYAIYNRLNHVFSYSSAGHPAPIVYRAADKAADFLLTIPQFPLNLYEQVGYKTLETHLEKGDFVVLYTDGLSELQNSEGEMVSEERLVDWIQDAPKDGGAAGVLWYILEQSSLFSGGVPPCDDYTLVVMQITN